MRHKIAAGCFTIAAIVAAITLAVGGFNSGDESAPPSTLVEATTTTVDTSVCDGHVVALADHTGAKVVAGGLQGPTSEENRQEVRAFVAHDPAVLMLYYNASPLGANPISSVESLVTGEVKNGSCFSQEGIDRFNEWDVLWKTARIERVDQMPPGWGNTGISGGQPTHGGAPSGDTSGIMVIFVDATGKEIGRMGVMDRCVNPVTPAPPAKVNPGPTDSPTPGKTTPPPEEGGGKDHRRAHPSVLVETSPEPTRDPTTTTSTTTTTWPSGPGGTPTTHVPDVPDRPDSGDGATNTTVAPTTTQAPDTRPPSQTSVPSSGTVPPPPSD